MVRRTAASLERAWPHRLPVRRLLGVFLDCAERLVRGSPIPDGKARVVVATGVEELVGSPADVRDALTDDDLHAFRRATLRMRGNGADGTARARLVLEATATRVTLAIARIADGAALRQVVDAVEASFGPGAELPDAADADAPAAERADRLQAGLRIDAYVLRERLGAGFSGEVWAAEVQDPPQGVQLERGMRVAMKIYFPHVLAKHSETIRIQREFNVAAEIAHEHIVRVFDLVLSPSRPFSSFLVMELLDGPSLKAAIPDDGYDVAACVDVGRQLASALVALHAKGALHRDIKPANVMLASPDALDVKLLDLGIVSLVHEEGVTEGSLVVGSKHTSAPEQLFGDPIDQRADIYGLGATLAYCWRGRPLYDEAGPVTAIVRKMLEAPERLRAPARASPRVRAFIDFVNRCTRIKPDERPESAEACLDALEKLRKPRKTKRKT